MTNDLAVRVPAANIDWIWAMVISSILDAGPVCGNLVGLTGSGRISGIDPRSVAELAATAAATAPYFRNSLRETFFSGFSISWAVMSDIDPFSVEKPLPRSFNY